jgi:predicted RNA-binding Zn-ribbon protein involved in translation (DUF1610 family)
MEKLIVLSVKCPHCGTSLMDESHKVNGHPGIKINIETERERGLLWLCPIYDCFKHDSNITLKDKELVKFFCPHCNKSLIREIPCEICKAPVVGFNINVGGKVNVCSRKGCTNHYVVFEDINDALQLLYDKLDNTAKK